MNHVLSCIQPMYKVLSIRQTISAQLGLCMPRKEFEEMIKIVREEAKVDPRVEKCYNTPIALCISFRGGLDVIFQADSGHVYFTGTVEQVQEELREQYALCEFWYTCLKRIMSDVAPGLIKQMLSSVRYNMRTRVRVCFNLPHMYLNPQTARTLRSHKHGIDKMTASLSNCVSIELNETGTERHVQMDEECISQSLAEKALRLLLEIRASSEDYDLEKRLKRAQLSH